MDKIDRVTKIKDVIYELSLTHKHVTRQQIIKASGIEDPEDEIEILCKKGIIMQVKPDDIRWV